MISSKKGRALVALAAAGALVAGVTATSAHAASKKITIAFVMGAESDPFFQAMKVGADAEAKAEGVTLIWQGDPAQYSPATSPADQHRYRPHRRKTAHQKGQSSPSCPSGKAPHIRSGRILQKPYHTVLRLFPNALVSVLAHPGKWFAPCSRSGPFCRNNRSLRRTSRRKELGSP